MTERKEVSCPKPCKKDCEHKELHEHRGSTCDYVCPICNSACVPEGKQLLRLKAIGWYNITGRGDIAEVEGPKEVITAGDVICIDDILCKVCSIEMTTMNNRIGLVVTKLTPKEEKCPECKGNKRIGIIPCFMCKGTGIKPSLEGKEQTVDDIIKEYMCIDCDCRFGCSEVGCMATRKFKAKLTHTILSKVSKCVEDSYREHDIRLGPKEEFMEIFNKKLKVLQIIKDEEKK